VSAPLHGTYGSNATKARLHAGMVVICEGQVCRVVMVNDCRARLLPVEKQLRVIAPQTGANAGQVRRFYVERAGHNVSPNSELSPAPGYGATGEVAV
jgi:hypothetical protein